MGHAPVKPDWIAGFTTHLTVDPVAWLSWQPRVRNLDVANDIGMAARTCLRVERAVSSVFDFMEAPRVAVDGDAAAHRQRAWLAAQEAAYHGDAASRVL